MKRVSLIVLVLLVAVCTIGLSVVQAKDYVIGASVPSLEFTYFAKMKEIWEDRGEELGIEAPLYNAENNQAKQVKDIEDMVIKQVDAIVLIPITTHGTIPAVKFANEHGVPVFTVDREIVSDEVDIVAHIGTNHVRIGEKAAELLLEGLKEKYPDAEKWNVVEIEGTPGASATIDRGQGIHNVLEAESKVNLVSSLNGEFKTTVARNVAENVLTANRDLHGVICHNDMMAMGVLSAAKALGRSDELVIMGIDGQISTVKEVIKGSIYATVIQYPSMIATGMEAAIDHLNGKELEARVWVKTDKITRENAQEYLEKYAW